MPDNKKFSKRLGYFSIAEKEITVREDAPKELRDFIRLAFYNLNKKPSDLISIVCMVLKVSPERNWTEFPNIDYEVRRHLEQCDWFLIYDIIEKIIGKLSPVEKEAFAQDLNEFFIKNGIGWKIVNERIVFRGDTEFETNVKSAIKVLETANKQTAKKEIREAILDLSRKPNPDITGAIQHSLACLECITREITGDKNSTLGKLMKKFSGVIPSPLDQAVIKIWGFASEQGRHLKEGNEPLYLEVELVVGITSVLSTYLGQKINIANLSKKVDDLPF